MGAQVKGESAHILPLLTEIMHEFGEGERVHTIALQIMRTISEGFFGFDL